MTIGLPEDDDGQVAEGAVERVLETAADVIAMGPGLGTGPGVRAFVHAVVERTGVPPTQYVEYAALRGDPSDNLLGVPGVGEKTAAKLIVTYGGIDGIYEHLDALTPKVRA